MQPSAGSAPGPEAPPGEAREAAPASESRARELQRAFRPRRGEANADTSVSFSTSAFKPAGGRHLRARGRRGLRCAPGAAAWPPLRQLRAAFPPRSGARSPRPPEQGRGAGRGERRGGPPGRGADSKVHEGRKGRRGHRAQRGAAHFSCAGEGVAQTARAWMRRSPSRGGRGAARAGDARRKGRLRSGRRMAEVSGRAGDGRGARLTRATCSSAPCASREVELRFLPA